MSLKEDATRVARAWRRGALDLRRVLTLDGREP
jgi:hypothetical protein